MDRKKREAAKARYEAESRKRSEHVARAASVRSNQESAIRRAYALAADRARRDATFVPPTVRDVLVEKAPRLLDARYGNAVTMLVNLPALRTLEEWKPKGKAPDTLFRSLAEHRLARFAVPAVLWNAFFDDEREKLVHLVAHVAGGGSMFDFVRTSFAIPLTRRMCHEVLATPSDYGLLAAIRRAQVRAVGGDRRLFDAWRTTRAASRIGDQGDEAFWFGVLQWFANQAMIDHAGIAPLTDYIAHRRALDPGFSMKGRSEAAMQRVQREWHGDLAKAEAVVGRFFPKSGFSERVYEDFRKDASGAVVREKWEITEIADAKTLAAEGRRMGHCVFSYAWRIERREVSIWSVQMEDGHGETGRWHQVTVEVRNDLRRVVQARGRFNRQMTPKEARIVTRWAASNGITMSLGAW
ncbi:MAG: PcfJ domain-containing protein [Deltaproteobacteria bacterium]|nr:PcfJ domain-containing protein [Deltaproteobacteria bacterium]